MYVLRNVFTVQGIRDLLREVLVELVTKGGNTSNASDNTSDNGGATLISSKVTQLSSLTCSSTTQSSNCKLIIYNDTMLRYKSEQYYKSLFYIFALILMSRKRCRRQAKTSKIASNGASYTATMS